MEFQDVPLNLDSIRGICTTNRQPSAPCSSGDCKNSDMGVSVLGNIQTNGGFPFSFPLNHKKNPSKKTYTQIQLSKSSSFAPVAPDWPIKSPRPGRFLQPFQEFGDGIQQIRPGGIPKNPSPEPFRNPSLEPLRTTPELIWAETPKLAAVGGTRS